MRIQHGDLAPRSAAGLLQWLAVIALDQLTDVHGRRRTVKRDAGREVPVGEFGRERLAGGGEGPAEQALLAEVRELLDAEVARLPDDQRRVVLLRDSCGEEWDRVAAELEREVGAAKQLHQRAWIRLRRALPTRLGAAE